MSTLTIKPATRQGVKPLVGLYGKSGGGKTMSALLLGRGLVGKSGRLTMIDTENGRGSIFADLIPGGYNVLELDAPFSPDAYTEAIELAEKNSDCIVVDSMSHLWSGDGGVLEMQEAELDRMAGDDYKRREACKMAAWIKPKMQYQKFIGRLLRLRCALICCLRAQEKTHIVKEDGKSKVITDEFSSPIFDHRFIFELLLNGEVIQRDGKGGFAYWTKITHPSVQACLPKENEQISVATGEALAKWCAAPGSQPAATTPSTSDEQRLAKMLKELEAYGEPLLKSFAEQKGWLMPMDALTDWPADRVPKTTGQMRALMAEIEAFKEKGTA